MTDYDRNELDFLRFVYAQLPHVVGPKASHGIYQVLKRDYLAEDPGNILPEGYDNTEEVEG